jgi:hypothetical protein
MNAKAFVKDNMGKFTQAVKDWQAKGYKISGENEEGDDIYDYVLKILGTDDAEVYDLILTKMPNFFRKIKSGEIKESRFNSTAIARRLKENSKTQKYSKTQLFETIKEEILKEQNKKSKFDPKSLEDYNKELEKTKELCKKLKDETKDM